MLSDKKLQEIIRANELLDEASLAKYLKEAEARALGLEKYLLQTEVISEPILYNAVASFYNLPLVHLKDRQIDKNTLFLIPEPIATSYEIIAFEKSAEALSLAVTDPEDVQTLEFIKRKVRLPLKLFITTPGEIRDANKLYHQSLETELAGIQAKTGNKGLSAELPAAGAGLSDTKLEDLAKDVPVVRVVDTLLEYAIFEGASDIHIEPIETAVVVRYRIDGILRDVMKLPKGLQDGIVARIKILSNLKLDEHRLPQDGRFNIAGKEQKISFRVSVIPVYDGEKTVLRLLDESRKILTLEELGLQKSALQQVKVAMQKPNGMVLVTGPTGSGKTTTLYTMAHMLNTPAVNISTVEDPIEYHMPRINQSQVNPKIGFSFANGLRALLRQDPDIIMVGEIRDKETANIAVNAAMTGHLVISTLHTNDAPTTLPRLLDMDIEPFLVSTTVNLAIAQRLVRKICRSCITSYNLSREDVARIARDHQLDLARIMQMFQATDKAEAKIGDITSVLFFRGKGCNKCGGQGYKGRLGIYEAMPMTDAIKQLIVNRATAGDIAKAARADGMLTMLEDGFLKAKAGATTIEEILRVTAE